jgi:membrane protease YdiL (CAAX protease family)
MTTAAEPAARTWSRDRRLVAVAWAATLVAGGLLFVVLHAFGVSDPLWADLAAVAVVAALGLAARKTQIAGYLVALAALAMAFAGLDVLFDAAGLRGWFDDAPAYQTVPVQSAFLVVPALAMVVTSLALGLDRRQLFLRAGNARVRSRIPATSRRVPWTRLAPISALVASVPLGVQLAATSAPSAHDALRALALLPAGLAFAVVNAVQEEVRFRAVTLAWLAPALGAEHALWLTSIAFGIAHWNGHPSGPTGVVLAGLFGAWLAKGMLDTRGLAVPAAIHAVQDVLIYGFLAAGAS